MDTARYVFGCLIVVGLPPGLGWWFVIHPFIDVWRRVGKEMTFIVGMALMFASMVPLYWVRDTLLMADLGTSPITVAIAIVLAACAAFIAFKRRKHLTMAILAGLPELEEGGKGGSLLTEGPYSVVRNPRYIEMVLGVFAYAAFSNYVGPYVLALVSIPLIHMIVILEERELRDRFGSEYDAYLASVPRYWPW